MVDVFTKSQEFLHICDVNQCGVAMAEAGAVEVCLRPRGHCVVRPVVASNTRQIEETTAARVWWQENALYKVDVYSSKDDPR